MPAQMARKRRGIQAIFGFLLLFTGLCTILALLVTVVEAWQERIQKQWPEVTAHVDTCGLEKTGGGDEIYHIRCRLSFNAGAGQSVASVYSRSRGQIGPLEQWLAEHPPGTAIDVRYDPANHTRVVSTDVLVGGPHTPSNIKLLEVCAASVVILLAIGRITRLQPFGKAMS